MILGLMGGGALLEAVLLCCSCVVPLFAAAVGGALMYRLALLQLWWGRAPASRPRLLWSSSGRQPHACTPSGSGLPHRSPCTSALNPTLACRFDFVRGYGGRYVQHYVQNTTPSFAVAEFWDTLDYEGSIPKVNQDRHRQQMIDWINDGKGTALCFDFTLKGILHAAFEVGANAQRASGSSADAWSASSTPLGA